jgi:hypothetical protein
MTRPTAAALLSALALGCASAPAPAPSSLGPGVVATYRADEVPPALALGMDRADAAIRTLRERLSRTVVYNLDNLGDGAAELMEVWRTAMPEHAREAGEETEAKVGKTSSLLRDPANAPPAWARATVLSYGGKRADEVPALVFDLGDRVGVLRPAATGSGCLGCHGPIEALTPGVRAALAEHYPQDRATGFAEGDLRGFYWAEARKR